MANSIVVYFQPIVHSPVISCIAIQPFFSYTVYPGEKKVDLMQLSGTVPVDISGMHPYTFTWVGYFLPRVKQYSYYFECGGINDKCCHNISILFWLPHSWGNQFQLKLWAINITKPCPNSMLMLSDMTYYCAWTIVHMKTEENKCCCNKSAALCILLAIDDNSWLPYS